MAIVKHKSGNYHIDDTLKNNLDVLAKNLRKDFDCFIVVSGRERFGKSTLAAQLATYLDPSYNLSRCVFTPEQFHRAVENAGRYQAIVFDEAHGALNAKESMTSINRKLTQTFTEMGFRNLIVILVLPSFFELGKYAAIHRSNILLHVHDRGKFLFFSHKRKKKMYIGGKQYYTLKERANFKGRFTKHFTVDKIEYEEKKKSATTVVEVTEKGRTIKDKKDLGRIYYTVQNLSNVGYKQAEIAKLMGYSYQGISLILKKMASQSHEGDTIILPNVNRKRTYPHPSKNPLIEEETPYAV